MHYPEGLLPQPNFKEITENLSGYFICRKVLDKSLLEDFSSIIKEELLGLKTASDCFDYSTNLPGVFELHHNEIDLIGDNKKYFRSYWDWNSGVDMPLYQQDFEFNKNVSWFFLQIDKINCVSIPFNKKAEKPPDETARAIVLHTPTNCNFWHFSIRWKDSKGFISPNDSKWKMNIIATIRALMSEMIIIDEIRQEIKEEWYIKN